MITKIEKLSGKNSKAYIVDKATVANFLKSSLSKDEIRYVIQHYKDHNVTSFEFNRFTYTDFAVILDATKTDVANLEQARIAGKKMAARLNELKISTIQLSDKCLESALFPAFIEGMCLANYQFVKHKTDPKKQHLDLQIVSRYLSELSIATLSLQCEAVYFCRDLVNEPHNFQSAVQFSETLSKRANQLKVKVTVFDKEQIEALKMGGLLGVNKGSINPPTFIVLEWKPNSQSHSKPVVLVGKGLVFDTGGMNLKTGEFMNDMKSDMAGAATMAATVFALAQMKSRHHVVALIPATDNRPGECALVPGDVITMRSGKTVEIVNTDAEGRLLLADALDYAKLYKPKLVIDAATLTGAASRAIGKHGIVAMQNKAENYFEKLKNAGEKVCERIVELPLWDEYSEELKSDVADFKNCGSGYGGAIIAGKFLTEFTDYPYIHLDIAGVAYNSTPYKYFGKHASGFGVRLLLHFFNAYLY